MYNDKEMTGDGLGLGTGPPLVASLPPAYVVRVAVRSEIRSSIGLDNDELRRS